jgi:hypothetical protein
MQPSQNPSRYALRGAYKAAHRHAAAVWHLASGLHKWRRYNAISPLSIVVLGMHRSGTSCVTRMINSCGASVGVEVVPANFSNKLGHWEALEGLEINDLILDLSGGDWAHPPPALRTDAYLRSRMRSFIAKLHHTGTAVWKDPRAVLTFPAWKPFLRNYRIVAVYRHPLSVAKSLQARDAFDLERGLQLWASYNERLLEICEKEQDVQWIDFDRGADHIAKVIGNVVGAAGLTCHADIARLYAPEMRNSDELTTPTDLRITSLYGRLNSKVQCG